jgi:AraC family transcriptional regulator
VGPTSNVALCVKYPAHAARDHLLGRNMRTTTRQEYREGLERVVRHVIERLDQPLEPANLAEVAGFSLFHFHRIFRGMMGESLAEFVRRIRLERAAWRLARGGVVTEIAFDSGYESHEAFTRAFRAAFGVTPSACRKNEQPVFELPNPTGTHFDPLGRPLVLRPLIGDREMDVEIREHPGCRTVAMRHVGPYWQIGPAFGRLMEWLGQHGVEAGPTLAIFHDNPEVTPLAELRSDACAVVNGHVTLDDSVGSLEIPPGKYAVATYRGPYSGLGDAWGRFIGEWFPSSGHTMSAAPCFELYLDPCGSGVPVEEMRTELWEGIEG